MRVNAAVRLYLNARRNEIAPTTRKHLNDSLSLAVRHFGPEMLVRNLRRKHVESWVSSMDAQAGTIRTRLSALRGFCQWAVAHGHLKLDPTLGVRGPRAAMSMPRELHRDAVSKTLNAVPDERAELIVLLAVQEGLRVSEITGLARENIDLTARVMLVCGKGNKERWLPISGETFDAMGVYFRQSPGTSGPAIRSESHPNRGLSSKYLTGLMARWLYAAGVKQHAYDGTSGHAFRHTFAGAMLDDGADPRDVQGALGHSTLGPTWIYLRRRVAEDQLRKSMGKRSYRT